MKCQYCERQFETNSTVKTLRGKKYIFCSESCFNLHFYNYPRFDLEKMYEEYTVSVSIPDIDELLDNEG